MTGRNTITYTVTDEGRDQGKQFIITEMSALAGQRWAIRMLFAVAAGGIDLPKGYAALGFAGLYKMGLALLLQAPLHMAEPLIDELRECLTFMPTPSKPQITRKIQESDIEEIMTYMSLYKAVWDFHTSFFPKGEPSTTE